MPSRRAAWLIMAICLRQFRRQAGQQRPPKVGRMPRTMAPGHVCSTVNGMLALPCRRSPSGAAERADDGLRDRHVILLPSLLAPCFGSNIAKSVPGI